MKLRKLRNKCNRLVCQAKNDFVQTQLKDSTQDPKKFWRILNNTFGNQSTQTATLEIIDPATKQVVSPDDCPDYMNQFLVGAGPKLAGDLRDIPFKQTFRDFLTTLKLHRITVEETVEIIDKIEIGKSSAVEGLSSRLLKDALSVLPIHLAFIFNLSLDTGVFPSAWKQANVILIPKDGVPTDPGNYRPISLLPLPGKLLEKLIHDRLMTYLNNYRLLVSDSDRQAGWFQTES